jgi:protein O-mannosyl-transferase
MRALFRRLAVPSVVLLAVASSVAGITNGFTYDDVYVVEQNPLMKYLHGWWHVFRLSYWPKSAGGDGYRPLTILAFRVQAVVGHLNPMVFHGVSIALYVLATLLVFWLARRLLPLWAAWVAGALFAVHPVHVEAVANVVGQSELWVALAILVATSLYVRDRLRGPLRTSTALWILLLYASACFAKEHGIVLPAILIAAELIVIVEPTQLLDRARRLRPFYLGMFAVAVGFVAARSVVLADHSLGGFAPFTPFTILRITRADRVLTAIGVVPEWLRLFFWPARLSADYGPPDVEIAQGLSIAQLPGFLLLIAIVAAIVVLRKRQPVMSFGIAFACLALLPSSNFLIPAGIVLAERTMFLASAGVMLFAGGLAVELERQLAASGVRTRVWSLGAPAICAALLCLGVGRSWTRSRVWHDNETLFRQSIADSPRSYRSYFLLGTWDVHHARERLGESELREGMRLFPYDPYMAFNLAEAYREAGRCEPALPLYRWSRELEPDVNGRTEYAWCLMNQAQFDESKRMALEAVRAGGKVSLLHQIIAYDDAAMAQLRAQDSTGKEGVTELGRSHSKLPDTVQKAGGKAGEFEP